MARSLKAVSPSGERPAATPDLTFTLPAAQLRLAKPSMNTAPYSWHFGAGDGLRGNVGQINVGQIASHSIYSPGSAAVRTNSAPRPLSATQPGSGGARRYVLGDCSHVALSSRSSPLQATAHNDAQYSSPTLLKQMAGMPSPQRRSDYGHENAALRSLDSATNASVYARARDRSEQPKIAPPTPEEVTPEAGDAKLPMHAPAGGHARRRLLRDAGAFYSTHGPEAHGLSRPATAPPAAQAGARERLVPTSISRQHALAANRSDPFGHSVTGRGHWSHGPVVR